MARFLRDLMTPRVVSVRADDTVASAVDRMTRYGFSALPVTTATTRLVGIVSLLDVIRYREVHAEQGLEADDQVAVAEIMNPDVLALAATANVSVVARRLADHGQLRVLPVVDGSKLVGIVTRGDLLRRATDTTPRRGRLSRLLGGRARDRAETEAVLALARRARTGPAPAADTPIGDVMTREVVTVDPDELVAVAAQLMLRDRHPSLPVVEADRTLLGIISEADILADPYAGRPAHATVGTVMTRGAVTLGHTATAGDARTLMADRGLRHLPVVDGGTLVGMLSRGDLV